MSRTKKWNSREEASEPKWFTHHGSFHSDPRGVKKQGAGKGNWGKPGDELWDDADDLERRRAPGRRNSNHQKNEVELRELNALVENQLYA